MAAEAADEPGILDARYEYFTRSPGRRQTLFLIRFHLGFSVNEWSRLPWWQQKMYSDELNLHLARESGEDDIPEPLSFVEMAEGVSLTPPPPDPDAQLAALGFNIEGG